MSESLEKSRRATSGWRRISLAAFSAIFAFILARMSLRPRTALPERSRRPPRTLPEPADDALDSHIRLRLPVTMASAPSDFTAQVLARIATVPGPELTPLRARRAPWFRSFRVLSGILFVALLLTLFSGIMLTMIDPNLAVAILDALLSVAVGLLAFGRMLGQLVSRASTVPWVIPTAMGALLGFLLLSWMQFVRQFGRDPQEA